MDKRGRLLENPFSYRVTKEGLVFIAFHGKQVTTLSGKKAQRFLRDGEDVDEKGMQLLLAKATGHFRHGNEREGKGK